ncbi:Pr6Pr family membrane protein [Plastorhodobacter daqingensis]|uniref:Pr6Pr family membrane protein n=1 Tax=Plastorhodobacter daqingensis TaxID=1387281 RepID=A0ABW2UEM5_9RHOB
MTSADRQPLPAPARACAALLAGVGGCGFGLLLLALEAAGHPAGLLGRLWWLLGFYTVLANLALAILMLRAAFGAPVSARQAGGVTLSMLVVSTVYHFALRSLWDPEGLQWLADLILHSLTPAFALGWWMLFAPKDGLGLRDLGAWLVWPLAYAIYMFLRALLTGFAPYPFLDPAALGWTVTLPAALLAGTFVGMGLGLIGLSRILPQSPRPGSSSSVRPARSSSSSSQRSGSR